MSDVLDMNYCAYCMEKMNEDETVCGKCGHVSGEENTPAFALEPGTLLNGKYLVGMVMGQGGFGITYIGLDLILQKKVAIKEYFPQNCSSRNGTTIMSWFNNEDHDSGCENFLKEARNMAKLANLNSVVTVHDLFYENNTAYIIMDFIEGENLKSKVMRKGPMKYEDCINLLKPIMEGLDQVHQKGFVHRDIKPDNIMIQPDGKAMLLDLGAAKNLDVQNQNNTAVSGLVVSHGFSPLEQYMDAGDVGPWSDVYSMTATIIYAVTGRLIKKAVDRIDEKNLVIEDPENRIPAKKLSVLKKGLALKKTDRYQTVKELSEALSPVHVHVYPPRMPLWKKILIAVGVLVAAVIVLFVLLLLLFPEETVASGNCGDDASWEVTDYGVLTISGSGAIDDYEYQVINDEDGTTAPWFKYRDDITDLVIEEGIDEIGECDFEFLDQLNEVELPNSLTCINNYAFAYSSLETIDLPSSVETIGVSAFGDCENLTEFTIPKNANSIDGNPVWNCEALTSIEVEAGNDSFTSDDGVLFTQDGKTIVAYPAGKSGTEYTVSDGVKTIGFCAFEGNSNLRTVTLPNSLTTIDNYAFEECSALSSMIIPENVESIGTEAFGYENDYLRVTFMGAPKIDNTEDAGAFLNTKAIVTLHTENDDDLWKSWDSGDKCLNYGGTLTWVYCQTEAAESDTGADNLFDNNTKTKWEVDFKNQKTTEGYVYVYFKTPELVDLSKMSLHYVTGPDNSEFKGRNPKNFTLESWTEKSGFTNCITFTETDSRDVDENEYYIDDLDGGKAQYFRVKIYSTQGSDYMQFSELYFKEKE